MHNSETARTFDRASGNRLTAHDVGRFPSGSLFDRLGRAVCAAGCLPRKELFEAWEMARRVRRLFRGGRVVDLAGGHGLLALALLLLDDSSESARVVDESVPPSAARLHDALTREWPRLAGRVVYDQGRIQDVAVVPNDLVVSCHACGSLTDEVLSLAASARARVAVLPCCHDAGRFDGTTLTGWLDPALAIDVARATRLESKGYRVWTQTIPGDITPKNRLLLGALAVCCLLLGYAPVAAQWPERPTAGVPRTADGRPNLSAPAPRTADGRPDLSGIWQAASDPAGTPGGVEGIVAPRYLIDITRDLQPDEVPFMPWAAALYKQRNDNQRLDNPSIRCLPIGVPRLVANAFPYKIVQMPGLLLVLYEAGNMFRQIFLDGRALPADPQPAWLGYSVGRWEGDVLVVESAGFNDKTWLDGAGHPHSEAMRLTERFTRRDVGHMDVEVVIDDPKAYSRPLRYVQPQSLVPDTELIEYVCENAKPIGARR
jgi:hypothetical protein